MKAVCKVLNESRRTHCRPTYACVREDPISTFKNILGHKYRHFY